MVIFPFCKINLGLNIISKRPDGYHNLETCFYPIPFYDVLEIVHADDFGCTVTGLAINGDVEDNLCVKACRLLAKHHDLPPVHIYLHKNIPSGAGLAGGSSDATHTLLLLNRKFGLGLNNDQLGDYALQLGSDCPFFIYNQPMLGSGRGEVLSPAAIQLETYTIVLVIPGIQVSTKAAFEGIIPQQPALPVTGIISRPVEDWKNMLVNDFETTVFKQHPQLEAIKKTLYKGGALYASLTGTGSVVYGLFKKNAADKGLFEQFDAAYRIVVI